DSCRAYTSSVIRSTRRRLRSSLFPYTTLFRSQNGQVSNMFHQLLLQCMNKNLLSLTYNRIVHVQQIFERPSRSVGELHLSNLSRSEEHTSELQSRFDIVCRLLLEKKNLTLCAP